MGQCNEMFFSFVFCTFVKIFHVRLGKKSKSVSFLRVYVCVKAKLTLVSFFFTFFMHLPLTQTQKPIFVGILRSKVRLGVPLSEGFSEVCLQSTNHSMLTLEPGNFHSLTNRRLFIIGQN